MTAFYDRRWVKLETGTRVIRLSNTGLAEFREAFGLKQQEGFT